MRGTGGKGDRSYERGRDVAGERIVGIEERRTHDEGYDI